MPLLSTMPAPSPCAQKSSHPLALPGRLHPPGAAEMKRDHDKLSWSRWSPARDEGRLLVLNQVGASGVHGEIPVQVRAGRWRDSPNDRQAGIRFHKCSAHLGGRPRACRGARPSWRSGSLESGGHYRPSMSPLKLGSSLRPARAGSSFINLKSSKPSFRALASHSRAWSFLS